MHWPVSEPALLSLGMIMKNFRSYGARYLGFNRLSEKIAIAALDSKEYYTTIGRKLLQDMGNAI